jgi:hypothetical protein
MGVLWTGLVWFMIRTSEVSCGSGNEPSCSIKCREVLEWLHNLWPLERDSATWG